MSTLIANACRVRSGGGVLHLKKFVSDFLVINHQFEKLVVFLPYSISSGFPEDSSITYINPPFERHAFLQIIWEFFFLPRLVRRFPSFVLLNLDAGSVCLLNPCVTISQDMLSFEPKALQTYFPSLGWLRLLALKYIQLRSLRHSNHSVFLTEYARSRILGDNIPIHTSTSIIPHGVDSSCTFKKSFPGLYAAFNILYISHFAPYKHQVEVFKAISILLDVGFDVTLTLVGKKLTDHYSDSVFLNLPLSIRNRIRIEPFLTSSQIKPFIKSADIALFASSCENLPITLLELMSSGLPLVCSNRGPMPDILRNGGLYFNPQEPLSIASALYKLMTEPNLYTKLPPIARSISQDYTWSSSMNSLYQCLDKFSQVK